MYNMYKMYNMSRILFTAIVFVLAEICFSENEYPRPTFPDVFQTEIEGTFVESDKVIEIDADMFFDRKNNRAALFITKEGQFTRSAFNFDTDENIFIDGTDCDVNTIPDSFPFFPFTVVDGKKKMSSAEEALFFSKSELVRQSLTPGDIPTLIYKITTDIPRYEKKNCDITHIFSKPDFELSSCEEGLYCASTLITLSVSCKNENGDIDMDHIYRFSRFKSEIEDESVFLPPPGVYCSMKSSKALPKFPSYFSFLFDIVEKPTDVSNTEVFKTHREIWLDTDYRIVRIDEFDSKGLLYSSKIFDIRAGVAFATIASIPSCYIGPVPDDFNFEEATRLPKVFAPQNDSSMENALYVGKRKANGFDYEVWSLRWDSVDSRIVEEIYFLEISRNEGLSPGETEKKSFLQASHVNTYTYKMDGDTRQYQLAFLNNYFINNYRTKPKEWNAFDVATCFNNTEKKDFSLKIEGVSLMKGSQTYREVLELLYNKIITATGVSVVRISELTGIFDGVQLQEIRGSILDNSEISGWPKNSKEPGMEKTFQLIEAAVSEDKLSFTFKGEGDKGNQFKVISVEAVQDLSDAPSKCFSGVVLAVVSLVLLLIGVTFGISAYYVFLKKRKQSSAQVQMNYIQS